jgi:hypothetical protein
MPYEKLSDQIQEILHSILALHVDPDRYPEGEITYKIEDAARLLTQARDDAKAAEAKAEHQ